MVLKLGQEHCIEKPYLEPPYQYKSEMFEGKITVKNLVTILRARFAERKVNAGLSVFSEIILVMPIYINKIQPFYILLYPPR